MPSDYLAAVYLHEQRIATGRQLNSPRRTPGTRYTLCLQWDLIRVLARYVVLRISLGTPAIAGGSAGDLYPGSCLNAASVSRYFTSLTSYFRQVQGISRDINRADHPSCIRYRENYCEFYYITPKVEISFCCFIEGVTSGLKKFLRYSRNRYESDRYADFS